MAKASGSRRRRGRAVGVLARFERHDRRRRVLIVVQSIGVSGVHVAAAVAIYLQFLRGRFLTRTLAIVVSFAVVQLFTICALLAVIFGRKVWSQWYERRVRAVRPVAADRVALHAVGEEHGIEIRRLAIKYPKLLEAALVDTLPTITGTGNRRLSQLAFSLGYVKRWAREFRSRDEKVRVQAVSKIGQMSGQVARRILLEALADRDAGVRLEAGRLMVKVSSAAQLDRIFAFALAQPLFVRAILIEDMRPYTALLFKRAVPQGLGAADPLRVLRTLEAIRAWRKAMPLAGFEALLHHPDRGVRLEALAVLPYVTTTQSYEADLRAALEDPDPALQAAAAVAAGKLRVGAVVPELTLILRGDDHAAARAAAFALAAMPQRGHAALESTILTRNRRAAAIALEALERARTGRLEIAVR